MMFPTWKFEVNGFLIIPRIWFEIKIVRLTWWSRFSKAKRADYEKISQAHKKARHEKNPEKYLDPDATPEINESKFLSSFPRTKE